MNLIDVLTQFKIDRDFNKSFDFFNKQENNWLQLITLVQNNINYPYPEYGSWLLLHLVKNETTFAQKFYEQIIDTLFLSKNESVLRNLVCAINYLKINKYRETELLNLLFDFIQNKKHKVALHVYSLYVLARFTHKYPELKSELKLAIELLLEKPSPSLEVAYRNVFINNEKKK